MASSLNNEWLLYWPDESLKNILVKCLSVWVNIDLLDNLSFSLFVKDNESMLKTKKR